MKRILAIVITILALATATGFAAERAGAVNVYPDQTSVVSVVNHIYWDLDTFWGKPQRKPGIGYYNYVWNGVLQQYQTECSHTSYMVGFQGFYCNGGNIYFDWTQQNGYIVNGPGDGAVALWMAHEYGHHAEWLNNINWTSAAPYHELLADCFAGLYFRYGVYTSKKVSYNDYLEARTMLGRMGTSTTHGTPDRRKKAFDYGFARVGSTSCTLGAQAWAY